jgi:hypothetical protein
LQVIIRFLLPERIRYIPLPGPGDWGYKYNTLSMGYCFGRLRQIEFYIPPREAEAEEIYL